NGGVLRVVGEDGVKDPGEAQDRVGHHDDIVRPAFLEAGDVAEEPKLAVRLEEGEVHEQIPDGCGRLTCVDGVDGGKSNKHCQVAVRIVDAVHGERHGGQDGHCILATVREVREDVPRVSVTTQALQQAPDGRQRAQETEKSRVVRVALHRVIPGIGVDTEEQLNVLEGRVS
ncbi:hypothetical protein LZ32DRAFT_595196, partial [Colletotrichum eremochloae]